MIDFVQLQLLQLVMEFEMRTEGTSETWYLWKDKFFKLKKKVKFNKRRFWKTNFVINAKLKSHLLVFNNDYI